jgi:IS30 family transposase
MNDTHLTQNERYQIYVLIKAGHKQREIAQLLNRHPSTISRELARNSGLRGYRPNQAQRLCEARATNSRNARRIEPAVREAAQSRLRLQHSPEQIAALLPVSHETRYQRIYADKRAGGELWRHLRCQKQRRKRYASGAGRRGKIPDRRPISVRPPSVEARNRIGHWEGDTLIGAGRKQAIVSLVERKSGYCLLAHVPHKTSEAVSEAIIRSLAPIKPRVKTLTFDNGLEFARHGKNRPGPRGHLLLCRSLCLVAAGQQREHQRPGAAVPAEIPVIRYRHRRGACHDHGSLEPPPQKTPELENPSSGLYAIIQPRCTS